MRYVFVVEGSGPFPHEQMDREGSLPASMGDAEAMVGEGWRRVELNSDVQPNVADWNAAGWIVTMRDPTDPDPTQA